MKKLALILVLIFALLALSGCSLYNRQIMDLTYSYEYAVLRLPTGEVIQGRLNSWLDFDDGDQIQVKIDGRTYLTHIANVVLISE